MVSCPQNVPLPGKCEPTPKDSAVTHIRTTSGAAHGTAGGSRHARRYGFADARETARSGDRPPAPWGIQRARKEQRVHALHADPILGCENGSSRPRVVPRGQLVSDLRGEATVWGCRSPDTTKLRPAKGPPVGPSSSRLLPKVLVLRSLEARGREDRGELCFACRQVRLAQARSDRRPVAAQRTCDRNLDRLVGADGAA
jgi:hypothetical protein